MANEPGNSPSTPPGTGGSIDSAQLQRAIDSMQSQLAALRAAQSTQRRTVLLGVVALVALMTFFTYWLITFAAEKIRSPKMVEAITASLKEAAPLYKDKVEAAFRESLPVYRDQGMAKLKEIEPELQKRFAEEGDKFGANVQKMLTDDMDEILKNVSERVESDPALKSVFPKLSDAQVQKIATALKADLMTQAMAARNRLVMQFDQEKEKFRPALEKFPIHAYAHTDKDEMARQVVLNMLDLAKYEVSVYGTREELPNPVLQIMPGLSVSP